MKTVPNGYEIELTQDSLIVNGKSLPFNLAEVTPEFVRSNRREEILLAIAAICAEEYGFKLVEGVNTTSPKVL